MREVAAVGLAYAIGSIMWSVVLGRLLFRRDVREGDNPGASGSVRTFGFRFGLTVLALDIGKGLAAVKLARALGATETAVALAAAAAVAGHNWPVWFGFRGGGGLATSVGGLVLIGARETAIGVAVALAFAAIYKHPRLFLKLPMASLPFGSLFGFPAMIWLFAQSGNRAGTLAASLCALIVGLRALGMLAAGRERRLRGGTAA